MDLLAENQFQILERLKTKGPLSVDAIVKWSKKPKTAVRRILLNLESKGLIQRFSQKSGRGRPVLYFQLSSTSNSLFPNKEAEILNELIQFLMKKGQASLLESFFNQYWEQRYDRVLQKLSKRKCKDLGARLEALKDVLNEDGFYARSNLDQKNDQVTLKECHCPISAVASATNIPCNLEAKLISRVLNAECTLASPMDENQRDCVFKFKR